MNLTLEEIAQFRTIGPGTSIKFPFRGETLLPSEVVHVLLDAVEALKAAIVWHEDNCTALADGERWMARAKAAEAALARAKQQIALPRLGTPERPFYDGSTL